VLERALDRNSETVFSLSLLDEQGRVLAYVGPEDPESAGRELYLFQVPLERGRGKGWGKGAGTEGSEWSIEVALESSTADFISRQARNHNLIVTAAILMLLGVGFYFARTLKRFLILKNREDSERHLASLGALSATLAHEIRNPLGAMKGLTQLVQEDLPSGHKSQELMKTVVAEAERLEQLVTDLLVFAKPNELRLTEFDLVALVREVSHLLSPQAADVGARLDVTGIDRALIKSDQDGMRQVLLNLILNAVEAVAPEKSGRVELIVSSDSRDVEVEIIDNGPGLGEKDPADLFLPFATGKVKGSGLGLAVSKRIVERVGGSIKLENAADGGVRCTIRIPRKPVRKV
jgi:two-component system sensor histidine kinase HydH